MSKGNITSISSGNLSSIGINFRNKKILIIGKRGLGKSWLSEAIIKIILQHNGSLTYQSKFIKGEIERMLIICPAEKNTKFYGNKFDCDIRYELGNLNDIVINELRNRKPLMVMDGCLLPSKNKDNSKALEYMITEMDNLTLIVTIQYPFLYKEFFRLFDYIFIGEEHHTLYKKELYKKIPTGIETYDVFDKLINSLQNYHFLMVDVKGINNNKFCDNQYGLYLKQQYITDKEYREGESVLIINNDIINSSIIVNNLIFKIEKNIDEIIIVNEFGENNYQTIVDKVYRPNDDWVL